MVSASRLGSIIGLVCGVACALALLIGCGPTSTPTVAVSATPTGGPGAPAGSPSTASATVTPGAAGAVSTASPTRGSNTAPSPTAPVWATRLATRFISGTPGVTIGQVEYQHPPGPDFPAVDGTAPILQIDVEGADPAPVQTYVVGLQVSFTVQRPLVTDTPELTTPTPGGSSAPGKLTVEPGATLRIAGSQNAAAQQQVREQLARFQALYPEVTLQYEPNPDNYTTRLQTQLAAAAEPDVFQLDPGLADAVINAGQAADLASYLQQLGRAPQDYFPALMKVYQRGSQVYGVPSSFSALMTFYNTDLLVKFGVPAPKDGWSQDEFRAFAKALTQGTDKATKIYGTDTEPDYTRWLPFAYANGAQVLDPAGKCAINSDAGVQSLSDWASLAGQGLAARAQADLGANWAGEAFGKQRVGSVIEGDWLAPFLATPANGFTGVRYDVAPLPVGKAGRGNVLFTTAWSASRRSKYPVAAAALILFLTGRENEQILLEKNQTLPTLQGLGNDPIFQPGTVTGRMASIGYAAGDYGIAQYYGAIHTDVDKALADAVNGVLAGTRDPASALKLACASIDSAQQKQTTRPGSWMLLAPSAQVQQLPVAQVSSADDLTITFALTNVSPPYVVQYVLDPAIGAGGRHNYPKRFNGDTETTTATRGSMKITLFNNTQTVDGPKPIDSHPDTQDIPDSDSVTGTGNCFRVDALENSSYTLSGKFRSGVRQRCGPR